MTHKHHFLVFSYLAFSVCEFGLGDTKAQSSPSAYTNSGSGNLSKAAGVVGKVALPPAPGNGASNTPNRMFLSSVPLSPDITKIYVMLDPEADVKIATLCAGIRPFYLKGQSYQGQTSSVRFLLSLTILGQILERGPMSETEALGIPPELASNPLKPEEPILLSQALAIAIADLNTLAKELYVDNPELLKKPTPFIKFVREYLIYLKDAEKQLTKSKL